MLTFLLFWVGRFKYFFCCNQTKAVSFWAKCIFLFSGFTVYMWLVLTDEKLQSCQKNQFEWFSLRQIQCHISRIIFKYYSRPSPFMKSAFGKRPGVSRVLCSCGRLSNKTEAKSGGGGRIYSELESKLEEETEIYICYDNSMRRSGSPNVAFLFRGRFPGKIFENTNFFFFAWPVKVCRSLVSQKFSMVIFESTLISPSAYDDDGREGKVFVFVWLSPM